MADPGSSGTDAAGDADPGAGVTATVSEGVCRVAAPDGAPWRWLGTDGAGTDDGDGAAGGFREARAAYNVTVPAGFDRTDLGAYGAGRRERAGFDAPGPTLFTGVDQRHARGARLGPVTVVATGGLSNPATLPLDADGGEGRPPDGEPPVGTVNLFVATARALGDGTLAELLATAVEARTATLLAATGFTGTTSDAVVVGCDPAGEPAAFAGSATAVGRATRACVRDALRASLDARYDGREHELPGSVADAAHGVVTAAATRPFAPDRRD